MSAWKEIRDIGKTILKGSAVMVGTKRLATFADRAIPSVADKGKEAWARIKSTKSTDRKKKSEDEEEEVLFEDDEDPGFVEAQKKKPMRANKSAEVSRIQYDAEFEYKEKEKGDS